MKKLVMATSFAVLLAAGYSCKGKNDKKDSDKPASTEVPYSPNSNSPGASAPVEVAGDETLRQGVTDATKDIKGLQTRVENGVIYLSGTISKEDNMRITPTLNSLRPKSINRDNLTVQ